MILKENSFKAMYRREKINHQIQRVVSRLIQEEIDNPNIGIVSIVRVETTSDLRHCKIFFSVFPEENLELVSQALLSMRGFIKKLLGESLRIKFLPDIEFISDSSIRYSLQIEKKLESLKDELRESSKSNKE